MSPELLRLPGNPALDQPRGGQIMFYNAGRPIELIRWESARASPARALDPIDARGSGTWLGGSGQVAVAIWSVL